MLFHVKNREMWLHLNFQPKLQTSLRCREPKQTQTVMNSVISIVPVIFHQGYWNNSVRLPATSKGAVKQRGS